ncbi:MAG: hypothetical protein K2J73_01315 [Oscillospiraceae bacterium]|nr:hypothetical protein [Oscillospiraceae bacterium]
MSNSIEFINDEAVIGKWKNIGWTDGANGCSVERLNDKSGEFEDLYFLPNGENYWIFEGWTKGVLLIHYGGNEPVLTYRYDIQSFNDNDYLFLRLDDKTEVFVKIDNNCYEKTTLGNHDNIDMPFVNDDKVIGKWVSVGFGGREFAESFFPDQKCNDLYLQSIEFFAGGKLTQKYMDDVWHDKWAKGFVLNLHRTTAAAYSIREINGSDYLFMEWKMGNYIYGGMKPNYYVFARVK